MTDVLGIEALSVDFDQGGEQIAAVRDVSIAVASAEILGIVGESGSGKTQVFLAAMGLLGDTARARGTVRIAGRELAADRPQGFAAVRGAEVAMVFQDPQSALTPHLDVGVQMSEVLVQHRGSGWRAARTAAAAMLQRLDIADAEQCLGRYPHELSGGMRQRVLIGMSLLAEPRVLIADEPTTALDVTVQARVLDVLRAARSASGLAIVLISHDVGVIATLADRIAVMYAGRIVESGPALEVLTNARHPYTAALLACVPACAGEVPARMPTLPGQPPSGAGSSEACAFAPRCPRVSARCASERPTLRAVGGAGQIACHHPLAP